MDQLRALSVRQPWAHAIVHFGKDIENRTRRLGHRGWTLIHASAACDPDYYSEASDWMSERGLVRGGSLPGPLADRGGIVGVARIVGSISEADVASGSPWWMGPFGLMIDKAHPLPFTPCKGTVAPLFWRPDPAVLDQLRPALLALPLD